jgi:hypothetical protein
VQKLIRSIRQACQKIEMELKGQKETEVCGLYDDLAPK